MSTALKLSNPAAKLIRGIMQEAPLSPTSTVPLYLRGAPTEAKSAYIPPHKRGKGSPPTLTEMVQIASAYIPPHKRGKGSKPTDAAPALLFDPSYIEDQVSTFIASGEMARPLKGLLSSLSGSGFKTQAARAQIHIFIDNLVVRNRLSLTHIAEGEGADRCIWLRRV